MFGSSKGTVIVLNVTTIVENFHPAGKGVAVESVFGASLERSLELASTALSTVDESGELRVWGYVPVVVAKWSVPFAVYILPTRHH